MNEFRFMTQDHPGCDDDEVYIGHWLVEFVEASIWKTKRIGPSEGSHSPVFIKIQEAKDAGYKWSNIRGGFHYISDRDEAAY